MTEAVWAILRRKNRFLLTQKSECGTWSFPSGEAHPKNTAPIITVRRGLKREVGIEGERFRQLSHMHLDEYNVQIFLCDLWIGKPQLACNDIIGLGWFTWAEMYALDKSLSSHINYSLLHLSYLIQHYDHHPNEWRECDESG